MFSSRGYTTGMFFGRQPDEGYNFNGESYRMSHELVGVVLDVREGVAAVALRNRLDMGDSLEYLTPGLEDKQFRVEAMRDRLGVPVTSARNEDVVFLDVPEGVRKEDLIRRRTAARCGERDIETAEAAR
jgi:putative protease